MRGGVTTEGMLLLMFTLILNVQVITLDPMGKMFKCETKLYMIFIGWSSTKFGFFVQYGIQDGGYGMTWFNIGPYGKNVLKDIWDN
jgi:hypothetical protein